ncbi:TspO/MBR-related protein [Gaertneriomyces semiglobifer]|nr:TspO/MBR-related protein [Gaertneriomyces semiglobifer]
MPYLSTLTNLPVRPLIQSIAIPLVPGIASGFISKKSVKTWYKTLDKPSWTPPNWVFPVAWTTLYTFMGISSFLVSSKLPAGVSPLEFRALKLYYSQLGLNLLWTPLFFGLQNPLLGLVDILALLPTSIMTMREFFKLDERAGWLFLPYCVWIGYATSLNGYIWWFNSGKKQVLGRKDKKH